MSRHLTLYPLPARGGEGTAIGVCLRSVSHMFRALCNARIHEDLAAGAALVGAEENVHSLLKGVELKLARWFEWCESALVGDEIVEGASAADFAVVMQAQ